MTRPRLGVILFIVFLVFAQTELKPTVTDNGGGRVTSPSFRLLASIGQGVSGPSGESFVAGFVSVTLEADTTRIAEDFELPDELKIGSFSPNPFNSSTQIKVEMPEDALLSLSIYDLIGKEIYHNANNKKAGVYTLTFVASDELPTGIYLYKIRAGNSQKMGKFILAN